MSYKKTYETSINDDVVNEVQELFQEYIVQKIKSDLNKLDIEFKKLDKKFDDKFSKPLLTSDAFSLKSKDIKKELITEIKSISDESDKKILKILSDLKPHLDAIKTILNSSKKDAEKQFSDLNILVQSIITELNKLSSIPQKLEEIKQEYKVLLSKAEEDISAKITENKIETLKNIDDEFRILKESNENISKDQNTLITGLSSEFNKFRNKNDSYYQNLVENNKSIEKNFSRKIDDEIGKLEKHITTTISIQEELIKNISSDFKTYEEDYQTNHTMLIDNITSLNELHQDELALEKENLKKTKKILICLFALCGVNILLSTSLVVLYFLK